MPEDHISPVLATNGEPLGMWLVQFPPETWQVFTDHAEAVAFRDAMLAALKRVSAEED